MVERKLSSALERQRSLIYKDIVSISLHSIADQLGPHADLAKQLIETAYKTSAGYTLTEQRVADPTLYYFPFVSDPKLSREERNEVIYSIGVAPLRDPLILIKTIREIEGKRYHTERVLLTKENKPVMTFWQASWEPKNKSSIPHPSVINIEDSGLPILGLGTSTEQRVTREEAFKDFNWSF